jgi:hypothetical protein
MKINDRLSAGVSAKSINQKIDAATASGLAGDAGITYKATNKIDFGATVQNIGTQIQGNDLPANVKVGCNLNLPAFTAGIEGIMRLPASCHSDLG